MSRVLTFARTYPVYHIRKGQPTYFVEKIIKGFCQIKHPIEDIDELAIDSNNPLDIDIYNICEPKWQSIRSGNKWKVGMKFSPRAWSGKPYARKQIILAPDIEIKKVWNIEIEIDEGLPSVYINGLLRQDLEDLALNDGLT